MWLPGMGDVAITTSCVKRHDTRRDVVKQTEQTITASQEVGSTLQVFRHSVKLVLDADAGWSSQ
eukprot:4326984-Amphidinium_carterae.1